jgi:hypothetical protein
MKKGEEKKRIWETPDVIIYGDVNSLTQQVKPKQPGSSDDYNVSGISLP